MEANPHEWPAKKVRDTFLDFFKQKGHTFIPSSSVVPHDDPSLLFVNSGMCQYKSVFEGTLDPKSSIFSQLRRSTGSQKCIRAGGKHNDLDDVGKDSYHHTFFEMLGNWSFGDYFKKEAIEYAWELLTQIYGLDPDRLYVTYFEGDARYALDSDDEAKNLWRAMGVLDDHIIKGNMKDNFWEMGETGPCGPSIELHYDKIGGRNAAHLVNQDDPNIIEIWNVVFMQFNREADKTLTLLPRQNIDTGLGFERLVSILQNKSSNYDTDIFFPLFQRIQEVTGTRPYMGMFGSEDDVDGVDTAYRVVADHIRTCVIAITDGAIPNNVGQGYVIRRILRRGLRYAKKYLQAQLGSFFSSIVPTVIMQMEDIFPEVREKEQMVKDILDEEEKSFAVNLVRGEAMFNKFAEQCKDSKELPGSCVWRLYDTYGFPMDLTKLMAEEKGLRINDEEVARAQEMAREASKGDDKKITFSLPTLDVHQIATLEKLHDLPKTDDTAKYRKGTIKASVKALYYGKRFLTSTSEISESEEQFGVILDKTNFYAESGGQTFDIGRLVIDNTAEMTVQNVQSYGGFILHTGSMQHGSLTVGDEVVAQYDEAHREAIQMNHTGTHILNFGLRDVLGDHITQKGSVITPERLRFDFAHRTSITDEELQAIEEGANMDIKFDEEVFASYIDLSTARAILGVRAIPGEVYPDPVRVVSIGIRIDELVPDPTDCLFFSIELCGGTHVDRTGTIKELVVLDESGLAKGIRRIVAITGQSALEARRLANRFEVDELIPLENSAFSPEKEKLAKDAQAKLTNLSISILTKKALMKRLEKIVKEVNKEQKKVQKARVDAVIELVEAHFELNKTSTSFVAQLPFNSTAKAIADAIKYLTSKNLDKSIYLISVDNDTGRVAHGCFVAPKHSSSGLVASEWAAVVAGAVGGKAGGKGPTSMGTGIDASKVDEGVEIALKYLENLKI
ncbi:alanyl-tRNA synthetase [Lophiotrema nucula]|uniref:Alanine--tRNA ligase n=1 Tax=Lophiotrema nucula TaxID=690887 RepID=A0A6A5YR61_9PLEO|nr:alanyl-tRNA synthetase [Lophiotrema nucula]